MSESFEGQTTRKSRTKKRKNSVHDDEPSDKKNEVIRELSNSRLTLKNNIETNSKKRNEGIVKVAQQAKGKTESGSSKQKGSSKTKSVKEDEQQDDKPETSKVETTGRKLRSSRK